MSTDGQRLEEEVTPSPEAASPGFVTGELVLQGTRGFAVLPGSDPRFPKVLAIFLAGGHGQEPRAAILAPMTEEAAKTLATRLAAPAIETAMEIPNIERLPAMALPGQRRR